MPEPIISNLPTSTIIDHLAVPQTVQSSKWYRRIQSKLHRQTVRRRAVRFGLLFGNVALLAVILTFVLQNPHPSGASAPSILVSTPSAPAAANPLDQLSSADIALTVARLNSLPEATAITNQADSQTTELTMAPTNDNVVSKPQVVATALKSRADIKSYTTAAGDTVTTVATKFGVTSDSIRWSNNLNGNTVNAGVKLVIPPVNGVVYTVKAGDTADSLAAKYKANKDKIVAFNDAEINGLQPGEQIVIPDGTIATVTTAAAVASASATSYPWGGTAIYGYNGYDYGYCTWYVANRIPVPSNWGNANTWDNLAPLSGWTVSTIPRAGAIAQTDAGYEGHVAVVEAVSDDGSMIKYSDMNGLAGWGRVGYSDWTPSTHFMHYIYR